MLGLQDIDDVRLAVGATKLTFYRSDWALNLAAIHEIRPHELAAKGSEFDPYVNVRSDTVTVHADNEPSDSLKNTEFLARFFLSRQWGDFSIYWGQVYEDFPYLEVTDIDQAAFTMAFTPEYKKIQAYGIYGNLVSGSWLAKFDLTRKTGLALQRSSDNILQQVINTPNAVQAWDEKNRFEWMGGFEYRGVSETTIMLEYFGEVIEKHNGTLADDTSSHSVSLYISHNAWHDKLVSTFWWTHNITEQTDLYKIESKYSYRDNIKFTLGIGGFIVQDEAGFYYPYRRNDRINAAVQYGF